MSSKIPLYGLGPPITQTDGHIRGCHLRTCEQMLGAICSIVKIHIAQ